MIGLGVGVRGPNPLEPRQEFGVNAAKQAREFKQTGAKSSRAPTAASDPSGAGELIEGGNGSEKALGVRVGGVGSDGFRWALLNKFAMFKDGDLIADVFYDG